MYRKSSISIVILTFIVLISLILSLFFSDLAIEYNYSLNDNKNDVVKIIDEEGFPISERSYLDIHQISSKREGNNLIISLLVVGEIINHENIDYTLVIYCSSENDESKPDFFIIYSNNITLLKKVYNENNLETITTLNTLIYDSEIYITLPLRYLGEMNSFSMAGSTNEIEIEDDEIIIYEDITSRVGPELNTFYFLLLSFSFIMTWVLIMLILIHIRKSRQQK
jgi:hypothetical protein